MIRKTIGLMLAGDDSELQGAVIEGVLEQAKKDHVNVFVFQSLMNCPYIGSTAIVTPAVYQGENRIFELPDYDKLDGIIALGESFLNDSVMERILEKACERNIPVVQIEGNTPGCYNILFDDSMGMEMMVRHVVEVHGARTINFISGFRGNRQSEERVEAYRRVLREYDIPVEENRIGYGEFGGRTEEVLEEYFETSGDMPDAIVCANDVMALQTINYITRKGYKVPKDVIVTGFDGLPEGQSYYPALASIRRPIKESGEEAVRIFKKLWSGKEVDSTTYVEVRLIENQSCGCVPCNMMNAQRLYEQKDEEIRLRDRFNNIIIEMTHDLIGMDSMEHMLSTIRKYTEVFKLDLYLALNSDVLDIDDDLLESGYTVNQNFYHLQAASPVEGERATVSRLMEDMDVNQKGNAAAFFYPVYAQEITIGYVVGIHPTEPLRMSLFHTWLRAVANAFGTWFMKKEHEKMVKHLDEMYVQDPLTKLYNRFGLHRFGEQVLEQARKDNSRVLLVTMDMNRLKAINDTYGHASGDRAILRIAEAIRRVTSPEAVCCRVGGDEFVLVQPCENRGDGKALVKAFQEELEHYNVRSGLPYSLGASCGVVVERGEDISSLEHMMNQADQLMYVEKTKSRK